MAVYYPKAVVVLSFIYDGNKSASTSFYVKSCSVTKKTYKEASEFEISANYSYFPFDPRIIVNQMVSIHIENAKSIDDEIIPSSSNLVLLGYVDEIEADAKSFNVTFKGKDYAGLFLAVKTNDIELPTSSLDIVSIFTRLKNAIPAAKNILIKYNGQGSSPQINQALSDLKTNASLDNRNCKDGNVWEFMQRIAMSVGLICRMNLDTIEIDDPLLYRMDKDNDAYCFGYPENTSNIRVKRKHGKYSSLQVEIRCLQGKQVISGIYPKKPITTDVVVARTKEQTASVQANATSHTIQKVVQVVSGNFNQATLDQIAQRVYNDLRSYMSEVKIDTCDLFTYTKQSQKSNVKLPIFGINIGDNVCITNFWDTFSNSKELVSKGWDKTIADTLASLQQNSQRLYYVDSIKMDFNTSGLKITIGGLSRLDLKGQQEQNIH